MKLCYQTATPDVFPAPGVTAYQSDLKSSFKALAECGYEGAELMVCDPGQVDVLLVERLALKYHLEIPMICTGEVFGQAGLCFSDPDKERRDEAIRRAKDAVDLAAYFGAQVNVGRLRGGRMFGYDDELCLSLSNDAMKEVAAYAGKKKVVMAIEPVNPIASNYINTTQEGLRLLELIDESACKLMLDSNHMFISDKDMIQSIYDAEGQFTYVHVVDSNRLYPGNCKLDFPAFIAALRNVGYDGWLSVEVFQRPDQDTALKKSYQYLHALIP